MARNYTRKKKPTLYVIPAYRKEVDVKKLCWALLILAKEQTKRDI